MISLSDTSIIFEDNHLLVVNKPADWITQGADDSQNSLLQAAKNYLKTKYNKPGNVYLGVVSRLDKLVTGAIVFARTSKAASRLSNQFRLRQVHKTYEALVPALPDIELPAQLQLIDFVRKNDARHRMEICAEQDLQAKQAILSLTVLQQGDNLLHLQVKLETGRKHQIRVQLANIDCPVAGDSKYGSHLAFSSGIALHSTTLAFEHPVQHEWLEFHAPHPPSWEPWLSSNRTTR
jgi:23S rRNA pseudouridine1911/1915/1917 synthase